MNALTKLRSLGILPSTFKMFLVDNEESYMPSSKGRTREKELRRRRKRREKRLKQRIKEAKAAALKR